VSYLSFGLGSQILRAFKYRDRTTIINDLLKTIKYKREVRKTQIMQSANLNYIQTKKYLNYLMGCGLVIVTEKDTYMITEKGSKYLLLTEIQRISNIR
jgi:predicted transcriptional regulator